MNLKKLMLACIAGLTSFSVMAVGPLVLDAGTNQLVTSWSEDLSLQGLGDVTGWSYKASGAPDFVQLASGMDDASVVKSTTKLDLNTSGGELKLAFGSAPLTVPTSGAYEYSVDTTFQFTKDWPTTLGADLRASGAKTAVFAMAVNADDDSQGARLIVAHGTAYNGAVAFGYVQTPALVQTGVAYRVTIRVKAFSGNNAVKVAEYAPATLFKVLVDGVEYPVKAFDGTTVGDTIGFDGTEYLSSIGTGAGNWLASVSLTSAAYGVGNAGNIYSVSFQGTGTLDNMTLATYVPPIAANWTLDVVGDGVVKQGETPVAEGVIVAGTYAVQANSGSVFVSVATNGTPITVIGGSFTLGNATGLDTVTVTFRAKIATDTPASADLADTTLLTDKSGWLAATSGKLAAFDAWVSAKGITFEAMNGAKAINAFLCNIAIGEVTAGLLQVSEVSVVGTTLTAKVNVGSIGFSGDALLVNGTPVAYVGTALTSMPAASSGVTFVEKVGNLVTITVTMPQGTSGFVKFAIE